MMSKSSVIAVLMGGLSWAGCAQAGFLGNNLELQFLQSILSTYSVTAPTTINDPSGVTVNVGDTTVDVSVPDNVSDVGLKITDLTPSSDPIIGASGNGGDVSHGSNFVEIDNLPSDGTTHVDVSFGNTVPEPQELALFALGLAMMGMVGRLRGRQHA